MAIVKKLLPKNNFFAYQLYDKENEKQKRAKE